MGSDAATRAAAPEPSGDILQQQSVIRSRERSTVVFCGEQVDAGFALALALMEADEKFPIMSPEPDTERD
jgi:hypothetical protein